MSKRQLVMIDLSLSFYLIATSFIVGIMSGFFGFGGGFILTPFLNSLGFPTNISVGTTVTQIFMSSIIALVKHRRLGNVDLRTGLVIALTSFLGAEIGAQLIEYLKRVSILYLDFVISLCYVTILGFISIYILYERYKYDHLKDSKRRVLLREKIRSFKAPPIVKLSQVDIEPISAWIIVLIGFCTGFLAGFLGAGGGFILVPLLIYVIGYKPSMAAGTSIFQTTLNCAYASFTHAIKGNVIFQISALMFIGSFMGLQIGVSATGYMDESRFKTTFALCLSFISLSIVIKMLSEVLSASFLRFLSQAIIFLTSLFVALTIVVFALRARSLRE